MLIKTLIILVCTICFKISFCGDDKTFRMTNDQVVKHLWIPAFAGMTKRGNDKAYRMTNDQVVKQIKSIITKARIG